MKKDLLGLKDISAKEIENILETAGTMKLILGQPNKKTPHLQGKTVVNLSLIHIYDRQRYRRL